MMNSKYETYIHTNKYINYNFFGNKDKFNKLNIIMLIDKKNVKVKELKSICKGLGITCKGTKSELISRIESFDVSTNFDDNLENYIDSDIVPDIEPNMFHHIASDIVPDIEPNIFQMNHFDLDMEYAKNEELMDSKLLIQEQDKEYEEALKIDKLKTAEKKFGSNDYKNISSNEIDLIAEKLNISFINDPSREYKINTLITLHNHLNETKSPDKEEDIQLSKKDMMSARLKYFS